MARVPQKKLRNPPKNRVDHVAPEIEVDADVTLHSTKKPVTLPKVNWTDRPLPKEDGKK